MGKTPPKVPSRKVRKTIKTVKREMFLERHRAYDKLPTIKEWTALTDDNPSNDPILRTIDVLIRELQSAKSGDFLYGLGFLFFTSMNWLNNLKKNPSAVSAFRQPILKLNLFAANELADKLNCRVGGLATKLQTIYGVEMAPHGVDTDTQAVKNKYLKRKVREVFRVFFVYRRACWYKMVGNKGKFQPCHQHLPGQGARFVLSMSNEMYVHPFESGGIVEYHSSFMGGRPVQCSGHISFDPPGKVVEICNSSGHYQPTDLSMVKVLHYLRMNGVDLSTVTVSRYVEFKTVKGKGALGIRNSFDAPTVTGDEFMRNNGNWNAITARAKHQKK